MKPARRAFASAIAPVVRTSLLFPLGITTSLTSTSHTQPAGLELIFQSIKHSRIPLNAQDIYQICVIAAHVDTLGMTRDADFMRGISDAFARSDQTVLSPFQCNLVIDTLRRVGIYCSAQEVLVPEEDAVSPESLLNVLTTMSVNRTRDERKIGEAIKLMSPILDEFSPSQLALAICELGRLQYQNGGILTRLARRLLATSEPLGAQVVSTTAKHLATSRAVPPGVLRQVYALVESRLDEFQPEDYQNCLDAFMASGGQYMKSFSKVVEAALNHVENMDATTLSRFIVAFTRIEYKQMEHVEIFADALVDLAMDLEAKDLVNTFVALQQRNLLAREDIFVAILNCLLQQAPMLDPRYLGPVIDVCSRVSHNSDPLMRVLLDRASECVRVISPNQLGDILDAVALYPPTRAHPIVAAFGRQAKIRVDLLSPLGLAKVTRGLATLGYDDVEFYTLASEAGFRLGFKDWIQLEPILMGLCLAEECPITTAKVIASHIAPMARSMSVPEIQRAGRYLTKLRCEEDYVFRALASRMLQFVKEITPDMPEELRIVLQKGAVVSSVGEGQSGIP